MNERDGRVKLMVYRLSVLTAVRILIEYGGAARSILWLSVGTDGSVYFGLSRPAGSFGYGGGKANSACEVSLK